MLEVLGIVIGHGGPGDEGEGGAAEEDQVAEHLKYLNAQLQKNPKKG